MSKKRAPFTSAPPPGRKAQHVELLRCGPKSLGPIMVNSREFGGTCIYWLRGRSCPHGEETCEGCELKLKHVWYGWLSCWHAEKRTNVIVEVTERCAEAINQYIKDYGTIRGALITLSRKNGKFNGPMSIVVVPSGVNPVDIPEPCDVDRHMDDLWDSPSESEKGKLTAPRNYAEPSEVLELRKAAKTKSYEATEEQLAVIAAHKARTDLDLAEAKKLVKPSMTCADITRMGLRREVAEALSKWLKQQRPKKTNGVKH